MHRIEVEDFRDLALGLLLKAWAFILKFKFYGAMS
jgi:hypothetical protein